MIHTPRARWLRPGSPSQEASGRDRSAPSGVRRDRFGTGFSKAAQRFNAGWSSPVARQAHNLKVIGSNPIPATTFLITRSPSRSSHRGGFGFFERRRGRGNGAGPATAGVIITFACCKFGKCRYAKWAALPPNEAFPSGSPGLRLARLCRQTNSGSFARRLLG